MLDYTPNMVLTSDKEYKVVGTRPVRHDGADKVTGMARYSADLNLARHALRQGAAQPPRPMPASSPSTPAAPKPRPASAR